VPLARTLTIGALSLLLSLAPGRPTVAQAPGSQGRAPERLEAPNLAPYVPTPQEVVERMLALAQKLATRRLARGVLPELDACFAALGLGAGVASAAPRQVA